MWSSPSSHCTLPFSLTLAQASVSLVDVFFLLFYSEATDCETLITCFMVVVVVVVLSLVPGLLFSHLCLAHSVYLFTPLLLLIGDRTVKR